MAVAQSVARPVRTGVQLISAGVIVEFVDAFFVDLTDRQYAALLALVTVVLGFLQVLVEDKTGKAFLRVPSPPEGEAPVLTSVPDTPDTTARHAAPTTTAVTDLHSPPDDERGVANYDERGVYDSPGILIAIACIVVIVCGVIWLVGR